MEGKEFYQRAYRSTRNASRAKISFFHKITRQWELHREYAAFRLLDGGYRFCDLGCGEGNLALLATQRYRIVYGFDISEIRLNRGMSRTPSDLKRFTMFITCNLNYGIPLKSNSLDGVACVAVLEHLFDPIFLVSEISRTLVSGGYAIIQVPNIAYAKRRLSLLFGRLPLTSGAEGWDGGHLHYFTMGTLCDLLEKYNLRVVVRSGTGRFAYWRSWWTSFLCGDLLIKAIKT